MRVPYGILVPALACLILGIGIGYGNHLKDERARQEALQAEREKDRMIQERVSRLYAATRSNSGHFDQSAAKDALESLMSEYMRDAFNRKFGTRSDALIAKGELLLSQVSSVSTTLHDGEERIKELEAGIEREETEVRERQSKLQTRSFYVQRQFDQTPSGKGIFEALDEGYQKCVLIAEDSEVQTGGMARTTLTVNALGRKPMVMDHNNAFQHFQTTEYFQTYATTDEGGDLADLRKDLDDKRLEKARLEQVVAGAKTEGQAFMNRFQSFAAELLGQKGVLPSASGSMRGAF